MSSLLSRLAAFREKASTSNVRVNLYTGETFTDKPAINKDRLVMYALLVAGAAALTHGYMTKDIQTQMDRSSSGIVQQMPDQAQPDRAEEESRLRLNYVDVQYAGRTVTTLDVASRIALSKQAAASQNLHQVGLSWKDLYGVINAETAWISRDGMGKNGVVSSGLAQMEPETAKGLGLTNPNDPIEAVHAAAMLMKEAGQWSNRKIAKLGLNAKDRGVALREGVSIFYNLSTRARNEWDGQSLEDMPIETIRHIENTRDGARIAGILEVKLMKEQAREKMVRPSLPNMQKIAYAFRLDGAVPAAKPATTEKGNAPSFSTSAEASLVQSVLTTTCPVSAERMTIEQHNASCLLNRPFLAQLAQAKPLAELFPGNMMLGDLQGVPVLMSQSKESAAMAVTYSDSSGESRQGILITSGLVNALKGGTQAEGVSFVLGHELGHLKLRHQNREETLQNEIDADFYGYMHLQASGLPMDKIDAAIKSVMNVVSQSASPELHGLVKERTREIEKTLTNGRAMTQSAVEYKPPVVNQFSTDEAVKPLQALLERPCAIVPGPQVMMDFNTACMTNQKVAQGHKPAKINDYYPQGMLVGEFENTPVLLVKSDGFDAIAMGINTDGPEKPRFKWKPALAVSTQLVNQLKDKPGAIEFVLAHEIAHVKLGHSMGIGNDLEKEHDADQLAATILAHRGHDKESIDQAAQATFAALKNAHTDNREVLQSVQARAEGFRFEEPVQRARELAMR